MQFAVDLLTTGATVAVAAVAMCLGAACAMAFVTWVLTRIFVR